MTAALLETLQAHWRAPVRLVWTENATVYLSLRRARPASAGWVVRLHRLFAEAPSQVWSSLERFLLTGRKSHLAAPRAFYRSRRGDEVRPVRRRLDPKGSVHDLGPMLEALAASEPFRGLPPVDVTWGPRARPGLRSVRLGCYLPAGPEGRSRPLVRLHRLLDRPEVPEASVAHVLHHELVHHYLACTRGLAFGRRHSAEFRRWEATFPEYERALEWQRVELPSLVRAARRRRRTGTGARVP